MLTVAEARARLLEHFQPLETEVVALEAARGRVLAEAIRAEENLPPFVNSSMDGYAVRAADVAGASSTSPVSVPVSGDIPAGAPLPGELPPGSAMRIMTGAPVPGGADAVVPVEETDEGRDHAHHSERTALPARIRILKAPAPGANLRPIGQDVSMGQVVLAPGVRLRPAALGVLAALGHARVRVYRQPRVALLSTGDELVAVGARPRPGQIRDLNSHSLAAAIEQYGGEALRLGVAGDRLDDVRRRLHEAAASGANLILSSAGVSVGVYDVVKNAIEADGALTFWKVNMRPGKPLAFGNVGGVPFIGLPGNPVSALVGFEVFVRPALLKLAGQTALERVTVLADLAEPAHSDGRETYLRVTLERRGDRYLARSTGLQGSNLITSLVKADGLLIIPAGMREVAAGATLPVWLLDAF